MKQPPAIPRRTQAQLNFFAVELECNPKATLDSAYLSLAKADIGGPEKIIIEWCNDPSVYDAATVQTFIASVRELRQYIGNCLIKDLM